MNNNANDFFSKLIPQTAYRYSSRSADAHQAHKTKIDLTLNKLEITDNQDILYIQKMICEADRLMAQTLLSDVQEAPGNNQNRINAILAQLGISENLPKRPPHQQVPEPPDVKVSSQAEQIWQQIEEKVLNNIKFLILRTYPAKILHQFNPKIETIVRQYTRYLPQFVAGNETSDLKTIAQLEFMETLKVWNPNKNKDIWPLAYARINGAMKDHIRYITKTDPSNLYEWLTDAAYFYMTMNTQPSPENNIDNAITLKDMLTILSDREKRIVIDHIYLDQTFAEISTKIKISESQLSRIYNKAIEKIKKHVKKTKEF